MTARFSSIVTPELDKSTEWVRTLQLSLLKSHVKIPGFRLYVVEEWIDDSPFLYSSVMVHTGAAADSVVCNVLKVTGNATAEQHKTIQNTFLNPNFPGLSVQSAEVSSHSKLGDCVCGDLDELKESGLHLVEVVHGALQGDALSNIRCNLALKLFNCIKSSQVSSAAPTTDAVERFEEMYRSYLQSTGKSSDVTFRTVVRRLVRRIQGALMCLLYIPAGAELAASVNKQFLEALEQYRADQAHQTIGITPEMLRRLRKDQEALNRKLGKLGYPVPADAWADAAKLIQAVQSAAATYAVTPTRRGWAELMRQIDSDAGADTTESESSISLPIYSASTPVIPRSAPIANNTLHASHSPPTSRFVGGGGPPPPRVTLERAPSSSNIGPSAEQLQQLKDATDVLETVVAKQQKEIAQAQAGYDSLYERYTAVSSKMYEALQEVNTYKLRVDELEGEYKRLAHDWNVTTDSIREYNETFTYFESRVLRLDEHINNMYRRSRGVAGRLGFFLLQLVVSFIGLVFSYGISAVYLFRRRRPADAAEASKKATEKVAKFLGATEPQQDDNPVTSPKQRSDR